MAAYTAGERPDRLGRGVTAGDLAWPAFTLAPRADWQQIGVDVGRHLGAVTSISVSHRATDASGSDHPDAWVTVVTTSRSPVTGILSVHDAMRHHLALLTSNHEEWGGEGELEEELSSIAVEGAIVDAVLRRENGIEIVGLATPETWVTVALPQGDRGLQALGVELVTLTKADPLPPER